MRAINLKIFALAMSLLIFCSSVMPMSVSAAKSFRHDDYSNQESCDSDHCDAHGHEHERGDETEVKIAIFDTGISGAFVAGGKSFVDYTDSWADDNGHGTAMAETLVDVLTVDAKIYAVKVLDSKGIGTHDDIVEAIIWAVDNEMDIVALSFAGKDSTAGLDAAITYAYENDILVIAAAGNAASSNASFPAAYTEAVAVGAFDEEGAVAGYSNYGDYVDVYALGTYGAQGGTSVAVQIIAAKAAAMLAEDCEMDAFSLRKKLAGNEMKDEPESVYVSEGVVEATACAHTGKLTTKAATCTSAGYKKVTCTKCKAVLSNTVIAKLGHSYTTTTTSPTCTAAGKTVKKCTRCSYTTTTTIPVLGHSYTASTTAPTCTADGKKVTTCSRCGVSATEVIAKLGHSYTTTTTAPTCTANGKTVKKCSRCASVNTTAIPMIEHNYVLRTEDATCTADGRNYMECTSCSGIGTVTVIAKLEHNFTEVVENTAPTCSTNGRLVKKCSECAATRIISIPMIEHNYVLRTEEATCIDDGCHYMECTSCGDIGTFTVVEELGHNYITTEMIAPTCTEEGREVKTCTRCSTVTMQNEAALNHEVRYEQGYSCGYCIRCNKCVIDSKTGESRGHQLYESKIDGIDDEIVYICKECGWCSLTYEGHAYIEVTKMPTCTENGYTCLLCLKCKEEDGHWNETPALGLKHDFSDQTLVSASSSYKDTSGKLIFDISPCEKYIKCKNCSMYQLVVSNHSLEECAEISRNGTKISGTMTVKCNNIGCKRQETANIDIDLNIGISGSRTVTFAPANGYAMTPNGAGGYNVLKDESQIEGETAFYITNNSEKAICKPVGSKNWIHIKPTGEKKYVIEVDSQEGYCSARTGAVYLKIQAALWDRNVYKTVALPITVRQEGYEYDINGISVMDFTEYLDSTDIVITGTERDYGPLSEYILPEHLKYFIGGVSMQDLETLVSGSVGDICYTVNNYTVEYVDGEWKVFCTFCFWYIDENGEAQFCTTADGEVLNGAGAFETKGDTVDFSIDYQRWRIEEEAFESGENDAQNMTAFMNPALSVGREDIMDVDLSLEECVEEVIDNLDPKDAQETLIDMGSTISEISDSEEET